MTYVTVDVDVDLYMFSTDDLIDELENRGDYAASSEKFEMIREIVERIYWNEMVGKPIELEIRQLCYEVMGKIV